MLRIELAWIPLWLMESSWLAIINESSPLFDGVDNTEGKNASAFRNTSRGVSFCESLSSACFAGVTGAYTSPRSNEPTIEACFFKTSDSLGTDRILVSLNRLLVDNSGRSPCTSFTNRRTSLLFSIVYIAYGWTIGSSCKRSNIQAMAKERMWF